MIEALNQAEPAVFAIMDYWTFDGWFKLQERLKEKDAPKLNKTVFPGIELRLVSPSKFRLNAHAIFSDQIPEQDLKDFLSKLQIELIKRPLSQDALKQFAREKLSREQLSKFGKTLEEVQESDELALEIGSKTAEIVCDSYKKALREVKNNLVVGFLPFTTNDGISQIDRNHHYCYVMDLFESSPIFETRKSDLCDAFVGRKTEENERYFDDFQKSLNYISRLAVSGSDAHCFVGETGNNDKRGYGDFPSNKKTWIKADPTFKGLQQTILEPAKRSYIGEKPPKLHHTHSNKTFYIDSIEINRTGDKSDVGDWLHGRDLPLNPDLVAIIGNKGSGKSALADIIAMLGNTKQSQYFSFLKVGRFYGKSGFPANQFEGTLTWCDTSTESRMLNEKPAKEKAEQVRYIPQGYFEELCNEHTSGNSNTFERELRAVIFSHIEEETRSGALNFEQLVEKREKIIRNKLIEYRKNLSTLNSEIVRIEEQLQPIEKKQLEELILRKSKEIEEHEKIKPQEVKLPSGALTEEQQKASNELTEVNNELEILTGKNKQLENENLEWVTKNRAINNIIEQIQIIHRSIEQAKQSISEDLINLGVSWEDLFVIDIKQYILEGKKEDISNQKFTINEQLRENKEQQEQLENKRTELTNMLNAPQKQYEQYQRELAEWEAKLAQLQGSKTDPDSKIGLETRLDQINQLPQELEQLKIERLKLTEEIFDVLEEQKKSRESLFAPVQRLIQENKLIREEYQLNFLSTLTTSAEMLADKLFAYIKQNSGEFRGKDESISVVKQLLDNYELSNSQDICDLVSSLVDKIENASKGSNSDLVGIFNMLKSNQTAEGVYNLIFGLEFLEPKYSLLFQNTSIEQLSPGQRGALLLIFYLLIDKSNMPIILDQPEENLDNETVYSLLVPVISEAKKKRQIIMVTHNPNLAVVCDAEQIIHAHFDRAQNSKITYESGAIENPGINEKVIRVLEGTKPAFNNRSGKYYL
ncbi:hypothetical protein KRX11_06525 [Pasteurellaceae bacterium TAE3-ERU1]|nr:hypothetical protein [Pasteurellaceae bacterium TAE3-ERU1]